MADGVQVPVVWVGIDETTVVLANQFIIQYQGNEFFLTAGQMAPPVVGGTPDEIREQLKKLPFVPIRTIGRFSLSAETMGELIRVLQDNLAKQKASKG